MKHQKAPYPLRLEDGVRNEVARLADTQQRSLNWQLNELVKLGLAQLASQNEKTLTYAGKQ